MCGLGCPCPCRHCVWPPWAVSPTPSALTASGKMTSLTAVMTMRWQGWSGSTCSISSPPVALGSVAEWDQQVGPCLLHPFAEVSSAVTNVCVICHMTRLSVMSCGSAGCGSELLKGAECWPPGGERSRPSWQAAGMACIRCTVWRAHTSDTMNPLQGFCIILVEVPISVQLTPLAGRYGQEVSGQAILCCSCALLLPLLQAPDTFVLLFNTSLNHQAAANLGTGSWPSERWPLLCLPSLCSPTRCGLRAPSLRATAVAAWPVSAAAAWQCWMQVSHLVVLPCPWLYCLEYCWDASELDALVCPDCCCSAK